MWHLDVLGDQALLLRTSQVAAPDANAQVHRLAARLRDAAVPGVRDIVPGLRDVVVHVDPLRCDIRRIEAVMAQVVAEPICLADEEGELIEIPVTYGGTSGPDLEAVARVCDLSPVEVCRRHAATTYRVCFVGFQPGFPYLGWLPSSIQLPRRDTPRPRVPAGSVAIAGPYTGIYPSTSPGGWHLIGHTDLRMFDPSGAPPALLAPGMRVRFVAR